MKVTSDLDVLGKTGRCDKRVLFVHAYQVVEFHLLILLFDCTVCSNVPTNPITITRIFPHWPMGQREVRHLTDPLALKLVRNGTEVSLMGSLMGFVMGL